MMFYCASHDKGDDIICYKLTAKAGVEIIYKNFIDFQYTYPLHGMEYLNDYKPNKRK